VLATDISSRMLHKGMDGVYAADKLSPLPAELRKKYFQPLQGASEPYYQATQELKGMVTFRRMNLNDPAQFVFPKRFDAIFCRNVMIYFDRPTQEALVNRLAECLAPGGYLYTGFSESLLALKHPLKSLGASVYEKQS
jgi:chemotaxis protein methyltransferase CheR